MKEDLKVYELKFIIIISVGCFHILKFKCDSSFKEFELKSLYFITFITINRIYISAEYTTNSYI